MRFAAAGTNKFSLPRFEGVEIVDSHLHVWSPIYPYARGKQPPPDLGGDVASVEAYREVMRENGISKAVVVQPINYEFDHRYLEEQVHAEFSESMKLMLLADPERGVFQLDSCPEGVYSGVRFNPYLKDGWLGSEVAAEMFARCGALGLPVGVMCFKGLHHHMDELEMLLKTSVETKLIIDHWGFFRADAGAPPSSELLPNEDAFDALLQLGRKHSGRVYVKLSAMFRVSSDGMPYKDLKPRLQKLLGVFTADQLMYGSDFPFTQQAGGYQSNLQAFHDLLDGCADEQVAAIMGGTACKLFFETAS